MNFKTVLTGLITQFNKKKINYALIGGFAMGLYGYNRATIDLDFLIDKKDLDRLDPILKEYGYICFYRTENVSQFNNDNTIFGEIDFIHAFRPVSMSMLKKKTTKEIYNNSLRINILLPEDIIGLKLQAIKNDPEKRAVDIEDIKYLLSHHDSIDLDLITQYADMLGITDLLQKIISEK